VPVEEEVYFDLISIPINLIEFYPQTN
jgi:hypothetical protein